MGRRPRLDPMWTDIALAGVVIGTAMLGLTSTEPGEAGRSSLGWLLGVAVGLPLLARRRVPEAVVIAITGVAVFQAAVLGELPGFAAFLALLIGAYSVGASAGLARGLGAMALALAGVLIAGAVSEPLSVEGVIIPFVYLGAAWGLGRVVRARTSRADQMAQEAERLAREQVDREYAAVSEERARISRELHDVVAHAVTTMVLQAGAAQAELDQGQERARVRLTSIEASGRQALDELRRVLAVTRDDAAGRVSEPMPTLAQLPALVESTSALGTPVSLANEVTSDLPPGLSLSAYRIVQEALTNVLKHSSATRAWVRIAEDTEAVIVEVRDDGRPGDRPRAAGAGRGLIGMRERAAMFGGSVEAGIDPERGGFLVRARLPLADRAP